MSAWRESVLAAEAKKAGIASEDTRLTPRPPSLIGRLAWSHCVSELVIRWTAFFNNESKLWREGWDMDGEQRNMWRTFGALKEDLSRISASWELTKFKLSTALDKSWHRSDQASSSTNFFGGVRCGSRIDYTSVAIRITGFPNPHQYPDPEILSNTFLVHTAFTDIMHISVTITLYIFLLEPNIFKVNSKITECNIQSYSSMF